MEINLIPALNAPNLKIKLEGLLINCKSFIGCTAFWSINIDFFSFKAFGRALLKPNSFFCADIQLPTNIDKILEYYKYGATEIYLHQYRQAPNEYSQNTNLLHSKILVFELSDTEVEIWIGSHNLTNYAISGLNLEASLSIKCTKSDKIYQDICTYLKYVRDNFCFKFDPNNVDIYKQLQTRDATKDTEGIELKNVVTLIGKNMQDLQKEQIIQLLSLNHREFAKFKELYSEIYLHTYDIALDKEYLYKCSIEQAGRVGKDKLEIDFINPIRFAYIGTGTLALLKEETKLTKEIIDISCYFVKISIAYQIPNFEIYLKPSDDSFSFWQSEKINPYTHRLRTSENKNNYTIQKATFDRVISKKKVDINTEWFNFKTNLEEFYRELENLISMGTELMIHKQSLAKNYLGEEKMQFSDILKKIKDQLNLPNYLKSQVARIIIELDKPK